MTTPAHASAPVRAFWPRTLGVSLALTIALALSFAAGYTTHAATSVPERIYATHPPTGTYALAPIDDEDKYYVERVHNGDDGLLYKVAADGSEMYFEAGYTSFSGFDGTNDGFVIDVTPDGKAVVHVPYGAVLSADSDGVKKVAALS